MFTKLPVLLYILIASILSCNPDKAIPEQIKYYSLESSPNGTLSLEVDTTYNYEQIQIEKSITIFKKQLIALAKKDKCMSQLDTLGLSINYISSYERVFKLEELRIIKFEILNSEKGYFSSILFCKEYNILLKHYHGHGITFLDSIMYVNNNTLLSFSEFTRSLASDTTIYPELLPPPPLPVNF
jgi:hypothetical protein